MLIEIYLPIQKKLEWQNSQCFHYIHFFKVTEPLPFSKAIFTSPIRHFSISRNIFNEFIKISIFNCKLRYFIFAFISFSWQVFQIDVEQDSEFITNDLQGLPSRSQIIIMIWHYIMLYIRKYNFNISLYIYIYLKNTFFVIL